MTPRSRTMVGTSLACVLLGVVAGLAAGGAGGIFGSDGGGQRAGAATSRTAETTTTPEPITTSSTVPPVSASPAVVPSQTPAPPAEVPPGQGDASVDVSAGYARGAIAPRTTRTQAGAVSAFATYAVWLVGSPAAKNEPALAAQAVGGDIISSADAQLIAGMQRRPEDAFAAQDGTYRILGLSGDQDRPDQVMVEVQAPLTMGGRTRQAVVGGVITWTPAEWMVSSMTPRDVSQTLPGLGWQRFADGK
ncbi:hypothetical protein [Aeromicrobium wangtongii]|uniref:hypothetical protein n=1 Tax=Aeromicrobium wangtongii TaxID=2969247 RepID=UPI0020172B54|nr:hypothetical protein [Aeromicrobium wangtongii]MCL3818814.1 hypothetical protein [Aeromicrobium wangtongii]